MNIYDRTGKIQFTILFWVLESLSPIDRDAWRIFATTIVLFVCFITSIVDILYPVYLAVKYLQNIIYLYEYRR